MYDSVLMNAAHIQAKPLNGHATRLYEALGGRSLSITTALPRREIYGITLHKRDKSVTKTETPEDEVSTELTSRCGSYKSAGFHFGGRGFRKSTELTRP